MQLIINPFSTVLTIIAAVWPRCLPQCGHLKKSKLHTTEEPSTRMPSGSKRIT
ncbi:hypothetical protein [Dielma fastidiosa]|uniref:hypothetical protein n=1 Tax=Dielma fastidiosa TaxID=1034346 RepID=UPI0023F0F86E|nr:hypothetical protein [Dielma fastidiosa]